MFAYLIFVLYDKNIREKKKKNIKNIRKSQKNVIQANFKYAK